MERMLMTTPSMASRLDMDTWRQTVVRDTKRLKPTHLSLFVLGQNTGHPIARMPFYAEVGVTSFLPPAKPECKLKEVIRIGLREFSSSGGAYRYEVYTRAPVEPLVEPLCDALSHVLAQETIDRLAEDPTYAAPIISGVIQIASDIATGKNIDANDPEARLCERTRLAIGGSPSPRAANRLGASSWRSSDRSRRLPFI
jgi:hypothetical protein